MHDPANRWRAMNAAGAALAAACSLVLPGCDVEKRHVGPGPPLSAPTGRADGRAALYASNRNEQSEGGRLFRWQGCDGCHADGSPGYLDLADRAWRRGGSVPEIYGAIAGGAPGMPPYAARLTPEQIWRLAGYVHGLNELKPDVRRRNANGLNGEPSGSAWTGPLG
jgi:mono/diheme cytochrome c family protein